MSIEGWDILITGGAGFIGSHLTERLADKNRIRILDTLRRNALDGTGMVAHPSVTLIQGDVLDKAAVVDAMDG